MPGNSPSLSLGLNIPLDTDDDGEALVIFFSRLPAKSEA